MNNVCLRNIVGICGGLLFCASAGWAQSPWLLNDNFEYECGDLPGQGGWMLLGSDKNGSVSLLEPGMTWAGYQNSAIGKRAVLNTTTAGKDAMYVWDEEVGEAVYVSFLLNVREAPSEADLTKCSKGYFFSLLARNSDDKLVDGSAPGEYGRLYLAPFVGNECSLYLYNTSSNYVRHHVCNKSVVLNHPSLIVMKYEVVDGSQNDVVKVWIDPNLTSVTEPTPSGVHQIDAYDTDAPTGFGGICGVQLRQAGSGSSVLPAKVEIDALRVARSWRALFADEEEVAQPELDVTPDIVSFDQMTMGEKKSFDVTLTGKALTEDVRVVCSEGLMTDTPLIPSSLIAGRSKNVTLTLDPQAEASGGWEGLIRFVSPEAEEQRVKVIVDNLVVPSQSAAISLTRLIDFTSQAVGVGEKVSVAEFKVDYRNLKENVPVHIIGTDADMFALTSHSLPAGSGSTTLTVNYVPTASGTHDCQVVFDFPEVDSMAQQTFDIIGCKSYDPHNLPTLEASARLLTLEARTGERVTATLNLTAKNCIDYIDVAAAEMSSGQITISPTKFAPSPGGQTLTVAYQPTAQDETEEEFTFSTLMGLPVTVRVKGMCEEPSDPEPIIFDVSNPYAVYNEDFSAVADGEPLSIRGWINRALREVEKWQGFSDETGHGVKVTNSDWRQPLDGKECDSRLITPALSYREAPVKSLRFRMKNEGTSSSIEVNFLNSKGEQLSSPVIIEKGERVPATWHEYEVNLTDADGIPDVFFVEYRFTDTIRKDADADYRITDFAWGSDPYGKISHLPNAGDETQTIYNLQGMRVGKSLETLPAGVYILNGRKVRTR